MPHRSARALFASRQCFTVRLYCQTDRTAFQMNRNILVTGAAGFIGSHFVEHLLATTDDKVVALDNLNSNYDPAQKRANMASFCDSPRVEFLHMDFCEPEQVDEVFKSHSIDRVVHLGAYAGVRQSVANPHIYFDNNVNGTLCLLEAARRNPVDAFVLVSSSTVYGKESVIPFKEDTTLSGTPASPYGVTKRAAELAGLNYFELHNVPVVCVRPFSVYGPRLRPDLALTIFADRIFSEQPIHVFGDGSAIRDFTHVSDICTGLRSAMERSEAKGQCINLGHGRPISVIELIQLIEASAGLKANIQFVDPVQADLSATFADLGKARRLLDYEPQVKAVDGIPSFVEWFSHQLRTADSASS